MTEEVINKWFSVWQKSSQRVEFPRVVRDALLKIGSSSFDVQEYVGEALSVKESIRDDVQKKAVHIYRMIKAGCKAACEEEASDRIQGQIFLLQARDGMNPKQTINVENVSLADVIAKNSPHRDD